VLVDPAGKIYIGEPHFGPGEYEITPTPLKAEITLGNIVVTEQDEGRGVVIRRIQEQPSKPGGEARTAAIEVKKKGQPLEELIGKFTVWERGWRRVRNVRGETVHLEDWERAGWK